MTGHWHRLITLGIGTIVTVGALVGITAPSASALLCGYPPKACPSGSLNPATEATVAPGILLVARADATSAQRLPSVNAHFSLWPIDVFTDEPFRAQARGLSANSPYLMFIVMSDGKRAPIGVTRASSTGRADLPAIRLSRPGATTVILRDVDGHEFTLKFASHLPHWK
jgi:hypothetical protein